ncbi:acyltransferase family protein [Pseudofulvibacter geojedonensis]|uniref:Acyltransferase family protein n=1 Tax=Pseudofulvibacter geojedonensis TaxID=1123758 RepID=A0ABW3HYI6_9FLAO
MRIEQLTFTRFIAAISIVIFHYGSGSSLFNNETVSFLFNQANIGVSYFYILSGFVMVIAYGNKNKIDSGLYLKNRLARIYPVYFLAIFLIIAIRLFKEIDYYNLLLNIFMFQTWIPEKALTINTPGWSISVELFFYILFPILLNYLYSKKSLSKISYIIISFWIISQVIHHLLIYKIIHIPYYNIVDLAYHPIMHLNQFLVGNLAGLFFINKLKEKQHNYFLIISVIILSIIILLKYPIGLNFHNGLLAILFVPLILFISLSNGYISKLTSKKPFVFLGEISFGIYILQAPVWIIFSDYRLNKYLGLDKNIDFTKAFFLRLVILIFLSIISYIYFEKPLRNKIKKVSLTKSEG